MISAASVSMNAVSAARSSSDVIETATKPAAANAVTAAIVRPVCARPSAIGKTSSASRASDCGAAAERDEDEDHRDVDERDRDARLLAHAEERRDRDRRRRRRTRRRARRRTRSRAARARARRRAPTTIAPPIRRAAKASAAVGAPTIALTRSMLPGAQPSRSRATGSSDRTMRLIRSSRRWRSVRRDAMASRVSVYVGEDHPIYLDGLVRALGPAPGLRGRRLVAGRPHGARGDPRADARRRDPRREHAEHARQRRARGDHPRRRCRRAS